MSNIQLSPQKPAPGFWKRLLLAITSLDESPEERLDIRFSQLEAEVARLSEAQKKITGY